MAESPGFERSTVTVRYAHRPDRVDRGEALIRELTGLDGSSAAVVAQQYAPIVRGVTPERARAIARRFEALGCEVELIDEPRHRYAYDPRHALRGDQPLARLRWVGDALAVDHGTLASWELGELVSFGSATALAEAVERRCATWRAEGLVITDDARSLLAGVSVRDERQEAEIRAADEPREPASVYTDWLQSQGDPRGLLVDPTAELLERHAAHLFGEAASLLPLLELEWTNGVLTGFSNTRRDAPARSGEERSASWPSWPREYGRWQEIEGTFALLNLPICACLRALKIRGWAVHSEIVEAALERVDPQVRAGLRSFALETWLGNSFGRCDLLPKLESLELSVTLTKPLDFPRVRALGLVTREWATTDAALRESRLPSLHALTLRSSSGWAPSMPIWDSEAFASVRSLTLLDAGAGQLVHDPSLLEGLLELPLVDRLERLDLRGLSMSAALLDAIAKARAKLPRELWLSDPADERRS